MRTNPGGQIDPAEIIGRDELVSHLWDVLLRQSLVLTAERRMGKTSVVLKMRAEATADKLPIYRDLERVHTPMEFTQLVYDDVSAYLSMLNRTARRAQQLVTQLGGTEVKGLIKLPEMAAPHWKTLLTKILEDLVEHQERTVILFWDELPLMLYNIKSRAGEDAAMEVLDTLRSVRQMHPDIRMVFTSSIGLHNVLSVLRAAGYANAPTNDMYTEDVPPLNLEHAHELAVRLLKGEHVQTNDLMICAERIAKLVDGIPYFIHHVVDQLKQRGGVATVETVDAVVHSSISDQHDRWHLRYYRERIDIYYSPEERPFALNMLDVLSLAEEPVTFNELFNQLKSRMVTEDREQALRVLSLLQRDHYVAQREDGKLVFRFPLIQRCWRIHRGVE
jgi:hypothetical protein